VSESCVVMVTSLHRSPLAWSRLPSGTASQGCYCYCVADLTYAVSAGVRTLLRKLIHHHCHRTLRYLLIGDLPGNDVVTPGRRLAASRGGDTASLHDGMSREHIECSLGGILLPRPRHLWFDAVFGRCHAVVGMI
jgi:hypothetical protein